MVNITQIEAGILSYIEAEIMPKASPFEKFKVGAVVSLATPKFEKALTSIIQNPIVSTLEVTDDNGFVDLEKVYAAAKDAIKKSGSIPILGIIFNESDIDKLYEHIKRAS